MLRALAGIVSAVVGVLLISSAAFAQGTAQLNGRVTDESGAVLPGVTVTATQTDTAATRTAVTDETGAWADAEPADRPVPARSVAAGIPHLRADRHRAAGQRERR